MNEFNPREFRRSLRRPDISDAEYRVAVELCEHANRGDPIVWPSVPTLAEDSAMTDRAVQKILRRLEDKGVIVCDTRSKGGRGKSSRWRLVIVNGERRDTVYDGETVNHEALNGEPRSPKPRTAVHPKKIEEERRRGNAPAAWRGDASPTNPDAAVVASATPKPLNHGHVQHPETWEEWCASPAVFVPVERPECKRHPNGDSGQPCGGCRESRPLREEWTREYADWREFNRDVRRDIKPCSYCNDLGQWTDHEGLWWCEHPRWRCNDCHDGGIVLNSDGKPGRQIRICNHDHSWHEATPEELAEMGVA